MADPNTKPDETPKDETGASNVPESSAPKAPEGPVTADRPAALTLRGDDRGAAPADAERSISLAEANAAFFAQVDATSSAQAKLSAEVAKAVASAVKKVL